ncbi:major facilitator superfamily domain-containing protein [Macrophomina phaseolina]|uniref:Major facilitator superfamily domain-containing protein n=1 Tax=Macrophomina phaseolina TaxID=35725 RepID=A0ABQ8GCB8_9PEZI|nr:major facilitator superfamily domain-containing protein [Macrophomina phaseolina]
MAEAIKPVPQEDSTSAKSDGEANVADYDPALDRKLLWKRDLVLVPLTGVMFTILFLDRTNIANARALGVGTPNGLEGALNMPPNGYNVALSIFYIPFVLFEVPANLFLNSNRIPPRFLLGAQVLLLGILGMCQGLTRSYGGLLTARFMMGAFEASLPAAATYLTSVYYTKREAAFRFAWFLNFALAGPFFSGLLAYAIQNVDGTGGYQGWRWVFIIEGLMTVFFSIFVFSFCPNLPQHAQTWFLKPRERERLIANLEESRGAEAKGSAVENVPIWKVLIDWRVHLYTLCFFCSDFTASSIAAFAPTILTELGWTRTVAQLMTMPVWAAGIVFNFTLTWLASSLNVRTPFILLAICSQLTGWAIELIYVRRPGVRYLALFFMSVGTFPQMSILLSWLSANLRGRKYLAVGMAWMTGFGSCANFISANVFIKSEAPRYRTGFTTGVVHTVVGFVLVSVLAVLLVWKNKKREDERAQLSNDEKEHYDELYFKLAL